MSIGIICKHNLRSPAVFRTFCKCSLHTKRIVAGNSGDSLLKIIVALGCCCKNIFIYISRIIPLLHFYSCFLQIAIYGFIKYGIDTVGSFLSVTCINQSALIRIRKVCVPCCHQCKNRCQQIIRIIHIHRNHRGFVFFNCTKILVHIPNRFHFA